MHFKTLSAIGHQYIWSVWDNEGKNVDSINIDHLISGENDITI